MSIATRSPTNMEQFRTVFGWRRRVCLGRQADNQGFLHPRVTRPQAQGREKAGGEVTRVETIGERREWPPQPRDAEGKRMCRCGCGQRPIPPMQNYYNHEHRERFRLRYDQGYVRLMVERRDHGICHDCGFDCRELEGIANFNLDRACQIQGCRKLIQHRLMLRGFNVFAISYWDAHHVIEWTQGGADLGLDNVITLCHPCHKKRHAKRRIEFQPPVKAVQGKLV
mgnify:FL=1